MSDVIVIDRTIESLLKLDWDFGLLVRTRDGHKRAFTTQEVLYALNNVDWEKYKKDKP